MNYLAHMYLSGDDEKVMVGNFIGDYVKGKNYEKYPDKIKEGILLHRQIDTFTDAHKNVKEAKLLLRADFGLYSGIVVDFFYDHALASSWSRYSEDSLRTFSKRANAILLSNFKYLPRRVQGFLPFLIQNKRLESYASLDGITESMRIMSNYTSLPAKSEQAKQILEENYSWIFNNFHDFMDDMMTFVSEFQGMELRKPV